jgi:pimeloyl-ACP methyl ester carboxylesterase
VASAAERSSYLAGFGLSAHEIAHVNHLLDGLTHVSVSRPDFGVLAPSHDDEHGTCPISWQPSIRQPVFYGYRDFRAGDEAPADVRVFYPSIDGSPANAPILAGCGHYPLVLFLHGHCQAEQDHYLSWFRLPAQLARCGYVVAVPRLAGIGGGSPPWSDAGTADLNTAHQTHVWVRNHPEITIQLSPFPHTGIVGHSYGGMLAARLATLAPYRAYVALSAGWHEWVSDPEAGVLPLANLSAPSLLIWGGVTDTAAVLEGGLEAIWSAIPRPKHRISFNDGGHWDYLGASESACAGGVFAGPCAITNALATDFTAAFLSKYLPPQNWASLAGVIPDSLVAPLPSDLTFEQAFYEGGHLMGFKLLPASDGCAVRSRWEKLNSTGQVDLAGA